MPFWPDRFHLESVRSGTAAAPFVGVLDGYVPFEAWSHRRLLVSAPVSSNLLQVRRTSDDATLEVAALANGELNEAGLLSFTGANSAAVAALRGQIAGYDLLQATSNEQRMIVDAGALVTVGGKAASRGLVHPTNTPNFGGTLYTGAFPTYSGNAASVFFRGAHGTYTGKFLAVISSYFALGKVGQATSTARPGVYCRNGTYAMGQHYIGDFSGASPDDYLISIIWDGTNMTYRDGTNTYTMANANAFDINQFMIGNWDDGTTSSYSSALNNVQEAALWLSDQTANEAAIRAALT